MCLHWCVRSWPLEVESIHLQSWTHPSLRTYSHLHPHLYVHPRLSLHSLPSANIFMFFCPYAPTVTYARVSYHSSLSAFTSNNRRPSIHSRPLESSFIAGHCTSIYSLLFIHHCPHSPPPTTFGRRFTPGR